MAFVGIGMDMVRVLERIYDVELPAEQWLAGVVEAAAPMLDLGQGLEGYEVEVGPWGARASNFVHSGGRADLVAARFRRWQEAATPSYQELVHRVVPCGLGSRMPAGVLGQTTDAVLAPLDVADVFGVNGLDAAGRGCVLTAFASAEVTTPPSTALWSRMAAHLAAGARLVHKRRPRSVDDGAEAVLTPGGEILHADGPAAGQLAREALRSLVVDVDRARARARTDPDEATRLWRALAAGRWSVVDRFDRDGRRFVVACPNDAEVHPTTSLSRREEQVVGYAALGHADKLIAYEMGLSRGTVAKLLARARAKLGVTSRAELITTWLGRRET